MIVACKPHPQPQAPCRHRPSASALGPLFILSLPWWLLNCPVITSFVKQPAALLLLQLDLPLSLTSCYLCCLVMYLGQPSSLLNAVKRLLERSPLRGPVLQDLFYLLTPEWPAYIA